MASTAFSAQGTTIKLGTTASAKTITAATKANPVQLTSSAHALGEGTIVKITSVAGMTELNNKVGTVHVIDANNFTLPGIDSTSYSTYTSGGSATPTQVTLGNVVSITIGGSQKAQTDVTNLASTSKEYIGGLADQGTAQFNGQRKDTDEGQMALWSSRANSGAQVTFQITYRDGSKDTFLAEALSFDTSLQVDGAVGFASQVRISGDVTRS